jgi:ribosomal protein L32
MPSRKGSRRFGKPKKPLPCEQSRKCITCGKTLFAGVRYCVSCGTHDEVDLDSRTADLDEQVKRSRERNFMEWFLFRISFGLWRF